jgi:hypothetical protein
MNERRNPIGVNPSEHEAEGTEATIIKVLEVEAEVHEQAAEDVVSEQRFDTAAGNERAANWHRARARFLESLASDLHGNAADAYQWRMELLGMTYEPDALALLERIKEVVTDNGFFAGEPTPMFSDDIVWLLPVRRTEEPVDDDRLAERDAIDVTVNLCEQRQFEGGEGFGINFSIDLVEYGGRVLGGLSPYNYTPDVWVDGRDDKAVRERWEILAEAEIDKIPDLLRDK